MFNFTTEEHRLIADSVSRLFQNLAESDKNIRQKMEKRIDFYEIENSLESLGIFNASADDTSMITAQVQAIVAMESGAACLPYPVLERLISAALLVTDAGLTSLQSAYSKGVDQVELSSSELKGVAEMISFADLAISAILPAKFDSDTLLVHVKLDADRSNFTLRSSVESDYSFFDIDVTGLAATPIERVYTEQNPVNFFRTRTSLLAAAEIAGLCKSLIKMTQEYLQMRTQFGQVLGTNQALKHTLSESYVKTEALVVAVQYAAAAADALSEDHEAMASTAKYFANQVGKLVAEMALQLHGAIGYTMEFPLHLFMRRIYRLSVSYGSSKEQADILFTEFTNTLN